MHKTRERATRRCRKRAERMRRGWGSEYGHRAQRGDVRSAVLSLLAERDMHGYEMIQELEERTGGRWRPSAGSIYPTLQLLEDEGLVKAEERDGKRVHTLTAAGKKAAGELAERKPPWENGDEHTAQHGLRLEIARTMGAVKQMARAGDEEQAAKAVEILTEARRKLYAILAEE